MTSRRLTLRGTVETDGKLKLHEPARLPAWCARNRGQEVTLTVERGFRPRSKQQNDRYWALLVPALSEWTGYTKSEAHEVFKHMFLKKGKAAPTGRWLEFVRSTTELSVEEHCAFTEECERFLVEQGIQLPAQGEEWL